MAIEYATVPKDALQSLESVGDSLYDSLGEARPVRALQRLRAVLFTPEQAELLGIEPGAAGLEIERRGFTADGRTVEFTKSYYRGDAYDIVAELSVGGA
jgi:GntR family transcriptional regulator